MNLIDRWIEQHERKEEARKREALRRARISASLKRVNQIKRDEKGYHRVYVSEMGQRVGYYLLPNLYE